MRKVGVVLALLLGLAFFPGWALATVSDVDSEVLPSGPGAGTACAAGRCFMFPTDSPTEVNGLGATSWPDIFESGVGRPPLEGFNNWHGADQAVTGIDAASLGISVSDLTASIGGKELTDVALASSFLLGTFSMAPGCDVSDVACPTGNAFGTASIQSGLVTEGSPSLLRHVKELALLYLLPSALAWYLARPLWRRRYHLGRISRRPIGRPETLGYCRSPGGSIGERR